MKKAIRTMITLAVAVWFVGVLAAASQAATVYQGNGVDLDDDGAWSNNKPGPANPATINVNGTSLTRWQSGFAATTTIDHSAGDLTISVRIWTKNKE